MLKLVMEEDDLRVHVLDQDTNVEDFLLNKGVVSVVFGHLCGSTCKPVDMFIRIAQNVTLRYQ